MKILGERLKELRQNKQLTQEQLAEVSGFAIRTIGSWEAEDRKPTIETLIWLEKFYGVSSDYILGLTDDPRSYDPTMRIEEPPASEESERPEENEKREGGMAFSFPVRLDDLPKDPQALARALEPLLEPIVRKILDQMQGHSQPE